MQMMAGMVIRNSLSWGVGSIGCGLDWGYVRAILGLYWDTGS